MNTWVYRIESGRAYYEDVFERGMIYAIKSYRGNFRVHNVHFLRFYAFDNLIRLFRFALSCLKILGQFSDNKSYAESHPIVRKLLIHWYSMRYRINIY